MIYELAVWLRKRRVDATDLGIETLGVNVNSVSDLYAYV